MSSYDQNLLDEAPKATRAQLQEGYNVDLLEQPPRRTPSMRSPAPQIPHPHSTTPVPLSLTPGIPGTGSKEKFSSPAYTSAEPKPRTSFWRSRNGILTIAILVLVVIGAVVGGAVGGTVGKKSNKVDTTGVTSNSPTLSSTSDTTGVTPNSSTLTFTSASPSGTGGGVAGQGSNGNSGGIASPSQALGQAESTASVPGKQNIIVD